MGMAWRARLRAMSVSMWSKCGGRAIEVGGAGRSVRGLVGDMVWRSSEAMTSYS